MTEIEIGLLATDREVTYETYKRKVVRFERGELAHTVDFPEVPHGSERERITHFRIYHPDGKTTDVPLSVPMTIFGDVTPILTYIDWTAIHEWSDTPMITRNRLLEGDPLNPSSGDMIVQIASLAVGEPLPEGWRVLDGNMHTSQIARVVLRYEIEGEPIDG